MADIADLVIGTQTFSKMTSTPSAAGQYWKTYVFDRSAGKLQKYDYPGVDGFIPRWHGERGGVLHVTALVFAADYSSVATAINTNIDSMRGVGMALTLPDGRIYTDAWLDSIAESPIMPMNALHYATVSLSFQVLDG